MFAVLLVTSALPAPPPLRVATLSRHDPTAWSDDACKVTARGRATCNLRVYAAAAAAAAKEKAELLVVPEAYALTVSASADDVFDTWISDIGSTPYLHGSNATSLQQVTISRLAKENGLAIASNIFVARDGKNYITQVIFSSDGSVVGYYDKHHLFVTELLHFHAGPFTPTVVDLHGRRLGLIICWEGFYPYVAFDWSQMEQLKREGSETFVWSIGGTSKFHVRTPDKAVGSHYATTYNVSVVVSDVEKDGQILSADGNGVPSVVVPLSIPTYTASAMISVATI